jgi:hypothetical protein
VVGNANVVGGIAGVLALAVAVAVLWPRAGRRAAVAPAAAGQVQAAVEYLARETLRYWRVQAKDRRITTPSPAAVRWRWASEDVAVPADKLERVSGRTSEDREHASGRTCRLSCGNVQ